MSWKFDQGHCKAPYLKKLWADGGYSGPFVKKVRELFNIDLEIVLPIKDKGQDFICDHGAGLLSGLLGGLINTED